MTPCFWKSRCFSSSPKASLLRRSIMVSSLLWMIIVQSAIVLSLQPCPCKDITEVENKCPYKKNQNVHVAACSCYTCLQKTYNIYKSKSLVTEDTWKVPGNLPHKTYYGNSKSKGGNICPDIPDSVLEKYAPLNKDGGLGKWIKHQDNKGKVMWQYQKSSTFGDDWITPIPAVFVEDRYGRRMSVLEHYDGENAQNPCAGTDKPQYAVCTYCLSIFSPNWFDPNYKWFVQTVSLWMCTICKYHLFS